ncbi:hypothetical protein ACH82I_11670 [Brevibacterium sp. GP-SGM9]|uniref:hypothetical protein n=1 Tax=unclassified Brevibacterium TaxID=2614124 RepID=UPI001E2A5CD0|nr:MULTISPECIES: hypothetical protein [unclassified Brevibacterium]MCD1286447.1 hypothetical protein [Brevibacterium sp. CCUG 69071]MDK8433815.1 hypothetical protein [Brevibacterium sp. H-BE7]
MQATLATSQAAWLSAVDEWINDLDMRSDGREIRRRVARILGFDVDWKTLTTSIFTWAAMADPAGIKLTLPTHPWMRTTGSMATRHISRRLFPEDSSRVVGGAVSNVAWPVSMPMV